MHDWVVCPVGTPPQERLSTPAAFTFAPLILSLSKDEQYTRASPVHGFDKLTMHGWSINGRYFAPLTMHGRKETPALFDNLWGQNYT